MTTCPICSGITGIAGMAIGGTVAIAGMGLMANAIGQFSGNRLNSEKSIDDILKEQTPCKNCHETMNAQKTQNGGIMWVCPNCHRKVLLNPDMTSKIINVGDSDKAHQIANNIWNV
jgi:ribosomal protein L37AE/L43A